MFTPYSVSEYIWRHGGRTDFWMKNINAVNEFIKAHNLKPIPVEHLPTPVMASELPQGPVAKRSLPRPLPFPGGIRFAHLHFENNVYVLNADQWKEFSGQMLKDFREKLGTVKTISFEQAIELSAVIDALP